MSELLAVQILYTEDDREELRLLRETLEARGFEVSVARLGEWQAEGGEAKDSVVALLGGSSSRVEELEALGAIPAGTDDALPVVVIASPDKAGWVEEALHWGPPISFSEIPREFISVCCRRFSDAPSSAPMR